MSLPYIMHKIPALFCIISYITTPILGKSRHKFIMATGKNHSHIELASNMWGASFVPQKQLLSMVDLLICHGGNNSVIEAFHFGVPTINIPFLFDNFDNAKLIQKLKYGIMLDQDSIGNDTLLDSIDALLYDNDLRQRLDTISRRIQSDNSVMKAVDIIDQAYFDKLEWCIVRMIPKYFG